MPSQPGPVSLPTMSHEQRAAFAAGVTERVFDLYADCADPYRHDVRDAITAVWERASGVRVPEEVAARLAEALDREADDYCDVLRQSLDLPFGVIVAVSRALEVALSGDPGKAEAAAGFVRDDVARAAHVHGDPDAAEQEELRWQRDWLQYVGTAEPNTARDRFEALAVTGPAWRLHWEG